MPAADPTTMHAALQVSGSILYAISAMIIVAGLLVVACSFRDSQEKD